MADDDHVDVHLFFTVEDSIVSILISEVQRRYVKIRSAYPILATCIWNGSSVVW